MPITIYVDRTEVNGHDDWFIVLDSDGYLADLWGLFILARMAEQCAEFLVVIHPVISTRVA